MSSLFFYIWFLVLILLCILILSTLFMENNSNEVSESPFECGFEPISYSRIPFSMQFFSITIIFLIFDLEVVVILPLIVSSGTEVNKSLGMSFMIFLLALGLLIEWYDGSLEWSF